MKMALAALVAVLVMASACSGRDEVDPTPTPGVSSTPTAPAATAAPSFTPTPQGVLPVPSRALVIEVASGKVTSLYESLNEAAFEARFDGDVIELNTAGGLRRYDLDGTSAPPAAATARTCTFPQGGVEIAGRQYLDVPRCGEFSPDGRWMTYQRPADEVTLPGGGRVPSWDQWVLDLASGATRELQKGLVHCGGCDGKYGPRWSPTSRYVAYAELGGDLRRFLSEAATGTTRQIGAGSEVTLAPAWHPTEDRIVYSHAPELAGSAAYEDLDAGTVQELPIAWPAAFDSTGRYLYSPAWGEGPKATGQSTTIVDAVTLNTVAELSGAPAPWVVWRGPAHATVAAGPAGLVAALQNADGCDGTSVAVGWRAPTCVSGGAAGAANPQGSLVAIAEMVGLTGPARGPGFETTSLARYDIALFDVASGTVKPVLPDVLSWDYVAPVMFWNAAGTHILVLAPAAVGL